MREVPEGWGWGDPLPTAVDPWAAQDGLTADMPIGQAGRHESGAEAIARVRGGRRPVFGRVYELFTSDPADGPHPYVGKTEQTIHQRVHGPNGHTSAKSVAKDPWKARILPGQSGYRLLETVYDTGDPGENDRALRRAEAFWIDRLRPTHNDVRPVRPRQGEPLPPRPKEKTAPVRRAARRRRINWRLYGFLTILVACTSLAAWFVAAMDLPWPWAPWAVSPLVGAFCAWVVFDRALRAGRKLKIWR